MKRYDRLTALVQVHQEHIHIQLIQILWLHLGMFSYHFLFLMEKQTYYCLFLTTVTMCSRFHKFYGFMDVGYLLHPCVQAAVGGVTNDMVQDGCITET